MRFMRNKNRKKAGVGILAFLLSLLLSMTALAAPSIGDGAPSEGTITVTKAGAGFTAYQILEASQSGDAYVYKAADAFAAFFGNQAYGNYKEEDVSKLNSAEEIKTFASQLHKFAVDQNLSGIAMESGTAATVKLGYYLVLETSSASEGAVVASTAMLVSVPQENNGAWNYNVTVLPKDNEPSLDKSILLGDRNTGTKRVDTSTASVGDKIMYEVTAKIPTYDKNAVNIKYQITDTLSTFPSLIIPSFKIRSSKKFIFCFSQSLFDFVPHYTCFFSEKQQVLYGLYLLRFFRCLDILKNQKYPS